MTAPLPRFLVFAGMHHEEALGAEGLINHPKGTPHAFHHVADAADVAEAAVARHAPTVRDPNGFRTDYDTAHIAEVTPDGLRTVAVYDREAYR